MYYRKYIYCNETPLNRLKKLILEWEYASKIDLAEIVKYVGSIGNKMRLIVSRLHETKQLERYSNILPDNRLLNRPLVWMKTE